MPVVSDVNQGLIYHFSDTKADFERMMEEQKNILVEMSPQKMLSVFLGLQQAVRESLDEINAYPASGGSTLTDAVASVSAFYITFGEMIESLKKSRINVPARISLTLSQTVKSLIDTLNKLYGFRYSSWVGLRRDTNASIDKYIEILYSVLNVFTSQTQVYVWCTDSYFNTSNKIYAVPTAINLNIEKQDYLVESENYVRAAITIAIISGDLSSIVLDYLFAEPELDVAKMGSEVKEEKNETIVSSSAVYDPEVKPLYPSDLTVYEKMFRFREHKLRGASLLQQQLFDLFFHGIKDYNRAETSPIEIIYQKMQYAILNKSDLLELQESVNDLYQKALDSGKFAVEELQELGTRMVYANNLFLDLDLPTQPKSNATSSNFSPAFFNSPRASEDKATASADELVNVLKEKVNALHESKSDEASSRDEMNRYGIIVREAENFFAGSIDITTLNNNITSRLARENLSGAFKTPPASLSKPVEEILSIIKQLASQAVALANSPNQRRNSF